MELGTWHLATKETKKKSKKGENKKKKRKGKKYSVVNLAENYNFPTKDKYTKCISTQLFLTLDTKVCVFYLPYLLKVGR